MTTEQAQPGEQPVFTLARRGELTMTVLTLARARLAGVGIDPRASIIGVIHPDGGIFTAINFQGLDLLQGFIAELQPRSIIVEGAPGEDCSLLRLAILSPRSSLEVH